jgi:hypothetical protein
MPSRITAAALLAAGILVVGAASPAATAEESESPEQETVNNIIRDPGSGNSTRASAACGDCDCTVKAHKPHNSHHNPGRTNGEGRTTCKKSQPKIRVTAQLWEGRWWGWDKIGKKGDVTRHKKKKVSAFSNNKCRNNKHRTTANSWVTFSNGKTVKGNDISPTVTIKC